MKRNCLVWYFDDLRLRNNDDDDDDDDNRRRGEEWRDCRSEEEPRFFRPQH